MIETHKVQVTVEGAAGAAAGSRKFFHPVNGRLVGVHLDLTGMAATTDVTISTSGTPTQTLLAITNSNTSGWRYPRVQVSDSAGVVGTYDGTRAVMDTLPVDDEVTVTVAQANAGTVIVTLLVER